ncbi:hypothetical protein HPY27_24040 [Brevibacillus sp. HB1.1]|nr:hypothetical protein [Brevibacillus sp. HB1.1]
MQEVLKLGMLGRNDFEVVGEEPSRRFYSGVLFPDSEFKKQLSEENNNIDPQPVFRSLAKNCNIGLEFLVKPIDEKVVVNVSGSFKLYPRIFPTYTEQLKALDYLINQDEASENQLENENIYDEQEVESDQGNDNKKQKEDGLKLLEKYRQIKVEFENIEFDIDHERLLSHKLDLGQYIFEAIQKAGTWEDLFAVKNELISKTGTISLINRPENEKSFGEWLNSIRSSEVTFPNWSASLVVEPRIYKDENSQLLTRFVTSLINQTSIPNKELGEIPTGHSLEFFDCEISVEIVHGEHIAFEFDGAPRDYKYNKYYSVKGINCVGENTKKGIRSETVPVYFQKLYRTRGDLSVSFDDLTTPEKVNYFLKDVASRMRDYLSDWREYIDNGGDEEQSLRTDEEVESCRKDMNEFIEEIESFELGIYVLNRDKRLMSAFNIMNEIFKESGKGKYTSWRLFQIIFIVRILPSLYLREMPNSENKKEQILKSAQYADVLWFPTGGGKTEAYLGLIVCALFFDRLRGKKIGVSTWIRFPLRMLSKNQLDRLAKVLIVAEKYRQNNSELNGKGVPFSIGFFAGGGNTDNFLSENKKKKYFETESNKIKAMLLHKCPMCNGKLNLDFDNTAWKILHKCVNPECFVYQSPVLQGSLPIYLTDSETYRYVPSVLCGTVDKLAILGRYREFVHIFGQVGGRCEKHGYFSDRCIVGAYDNYNSCEAKVTPSNKAKTQTLKEAFYDPVPFFLIQDELHLLKEELGALNGHYEGVLNELARTFGREKYHLPKVIAATATIESYEHHINHLYTRPPRKYPSMGYKNGESFYATSSPEILRRLYLGILPHTRSQEEVIGRCLYLYHREIKRLYSTASCAWKEIGLKSITSEDQFEDFLSNYDLSVVYVNQKSMGHDVKRRINETTTPSLRRDSDQEFDLQVEMLTGENDMDKIVAAIDRIESEGHGKEYKDKLHTLIATSLISHGVDLERINAFFMAGMPSKQAEYIQASSRSARTHAGLVVVSFRPNDLRERSQYQYFIQNHTFLDRLVDPVPINRMAIKAIERTIPGILSGLLLCLHSQKHEKTIYSCGEYQKYIANLTTRGVHITDELINQLKSIIGTNHEYFSLTSREKANEVIEEIFNEKDHILTSSPITTKIKDEKVLNPITSFRDIEEGLPLLSTPETAVILKTSAL